MLRRPIQVASCLALAAVIPAQIELPPPLEGAYTVGPKATGNRAFRSLDTAIRYISLVGIAGDFRLEVQPGTYKGSLMFFPVQGLQEDQKVVVRASGQGVVRIESDGPLVRFQEGAKRIVIEGFTFGASGRRPTIVAGTGVTDIEIRGCHFTEESGSDRMIEIQGRNSSRRWKIHDNRFDLGSGISYGIYTQSTYELSIEGNEFVMNGCREVISMWNANRSQSRVVNNVFRGRVSSCCLRLDVSGHDVNVVDNLFYVELSGNRNAVIRSQGMRNTAYNKIRHNAFIIRGDGAAITTRGPLAIEHNLYANEEGPIGIVKNDAHEKLADWQEAVATVAVDDAADQSSATAQPKFFKRFEQLLTLVHDFEDEDEPDPRRRRANALDEQAELQLLLATLKSDDPVAVHLAMRRLRDKGKKAIAAVPALGRLCGHAHAAIRATAVEMLAEIRIGAEIVIPELFKLLKDKDERVLLATVRALGSFAHLAAEAAPRLQALEDHSSEAVQAAAGKARRAVLGLPEPKVQKDAGGAVEDKDKKAGDGAGKKAGEAPVRREKIKTIGPGR